MESYCEEQARLARMCRETADYSPEAINAQRLVVKLAKRQYDVDKALTLIESVGIEDLTVVQRYRLLTILDLEAK